MLFLDKRVVNHKKRPSCKNSRARQICILHIFINPGILERVRKTRRINQEMVISAGKRREMVLSALSEDG